MQERPVMMSELYRLKRQLGSDVFPAIDQMYFNNKDIIKKPIYDKYVVKVGPGHAGYGKMKITSKEQFDDASSIIQLYQDYFTAEPFVDYKYDLRIQKIGDHYRGFKRESTSGSWKANVGIPKVEDFELEKKHITYIEESAKLFGGLDICALDVLGDVDGNEFILELNDTAIGLNPKYDAEDTERIAKLSLKKMNEIFCSK
jgi:synapsin